MKINSCFFSLLAGFLLPGVILAGTDVEGRWGVTDSTTDEAIHWPDNWPGVHDLRAQWWKILAEDSAAWKASGYLNHAKGEPPGNSYFLWRYDEPLPEGTKILLEGDFPHARMMSFQVSAPWQQDLPYMGDGTGIHEVPLLDVDIEPDPGSSNPFRPGADRNTRWRHYHVTFVLKDGDPAVLNPDAMRPPYRAAGNLRVAGTRSGKYGKRGPVLWMRIYLPDGHDAYAGVSPPVIRIQRPGEAPILAPITREVELNINRTDAGDYSIKENPAFANGRSKREQESLQWLREWAQKGLEQAGKPTQTDTLVRRFFSAPDGRLRLIKLDDPAFFIGWLKHIRDADFCSGHLPKLYAYLYGKGHERPPPANDSHSSGQNLYNSYLTSAVSLKPGEILVFHGKAAATPHTLGGDARMTAATQLRYWNITLQAGHPQRLTPVVDISDEEVILDDQDFYTIAIGRPEDRPANADAAHGISWRDWPAGDALAVSIRMMSTNTNTWKYAPQLISWLDTDYCDNNKWPQAVEQRMKEYAPEGRYLSVAQVSALAQGKNWQQVVNSVAVKHHVPASSLNSSDIPASSGSHSGKIEVDGQQRSFILHRPRGVAADAIMPLIIVLHGGRMKGWQMEYFTNMSQLADSEHFMVVYPDGAGEYQGTSGWFNDGRLRKPNDVHFLSALIVALIDQAHVDPRRIYMTGFSNGA
ncbi:MAG: hypothetical protein KZQ58_03770, partial [gamma proteobacterium symbiont of Bathyaustriella thionipta]|nr:hypothetical protein [gamma proteobacterium symbiont of Bathyaustriella thionipta]